MQSMTGYGEARSESDRLRVEARCRSVNHRYLDVALRLPEELRPYEARLRQAVADMLHRGRVEIQLEIRFLEVRNAVLEVDEEALASLTRVADELLAKGAIAARPTLGDLLRFPELLRVRREGAEIDESDVELVVETVVGALLALVATRGSEGDKLAAILRERLAGLATLVAALQATSGATQEELERGMRRRLAELAEAPGLPEERVAQEIVVLLERSDVREELDRLQAHIDSFAEVLELAGPIGKRLDFLAQEILRELNTLAAKCRSSGMVGSVVEGKLICEQIREQVQNIE